MIETQQLKKAYGSHEALKGIDLQVESGDVYGFIGPNGAGKTTTIRILTTLLQPTEGSATIDGLSVTDDPSRIRGMIGYMPDDFGVYQDMTVTEYLHFFAAAYGIDRSGRDSLVGGLLELVDLSVKADSLIDALSRGMQQRLGLARTLVHDPKVLILDEPASGLDPRARIEIREILRELQRMGKTILLSSHILSELQSICTRIGILEQGELVAQGTVAEVVAQTQAHADVQLRTTDDPRAAVVVQEVPGVLTSNHEADDDAVALTVAHDLDLAAITALLADRGIHIRHLERRDPSLEDVFMTLTRGAVS
ncbi:MAG: ABC transporter ATP-binding protein [Myxococcota bacterium]